MSGHTDDREKRRHRSVSTLAFLGFALIALYFLFAEHRAHLIGALPYLLLAACPLMHLFHHHGGHGHHHGKRDGAEPPAPESQSRQDRQ